MNKQEILSRLDKKAVYQELIPSLKVNGKPDALGLCPVHGDNHPSLSVNLETGLFRCFSCNFKGDIFTFYQRVKDVDFPTALQEIGKMAIKFAIALHRKSGWYGTVRRGVSITTDKFSGWQRRPFIIPTVKRMNLVTPT